MEQMEWLKQEEKKHLYEEVFDITFTSIETTKFTYEQLKRLLLEEYLKSGENEKLFLKQDRHIKNNAQSYGKVTITIKEYIDNVPKNNNPRILDPEYKLIDYIPLTKYTHDELRESLNYYKGKIYPFTGLHHLVTEITEILKEENQNVAIVGTMINGEFMPAIRKLIAKKDVKQSMLQWLKSGSHDYTSFSLNQQHFDNVKISYDDFNNSYTNKTLNVDIYNYCLKRLDSSSLTAKQHLELLSKSPWKNKMNFVK